MSDKNKTIAEKLAEKYGVTRGWIYILHQRLGRWPIKSDFGAKGRPRKYK